MTLRPRFENMLTGGNLLTIIAMVVGGLFAFFQVQADVQQLRDAVMDMKADNESAEVRLRALELGFGRVEERLVSIQTSLQQLLTQGGN